MQFRVRAYRPSDGVITIFVDGKSSVEVSVDAEQQGYKVLSIRQSGTLKQFSLGLRNRRRFSVSLFSQELLALVDAGLNLVEALDILKVKSKQPETIRVISMLHQSLREGWPLSNALERVGSYFSPLYIASIRSSERTGDLSEALRRFLEYNRQVSQIRDRIISASIYPALLIAVGGLIILFLMFYVVPRFGQIYDQLGGDVPLMSRVLLGWGNLVERHAGSLAFVMGITLALSIYAIRKPHTRDYLTQKIWSIPAVGEKLRLYELARMSRTLAMLLNGGIPVSTALEMVGGLLSQPPLARAAVDANTDIRDGERISVAFERHGLATEVGVRLIAVGERSGQMAEVMDRVADFYDGEIERWLDWFSKLFEPALMIVIGLLIGGIVLLMYMPIFELATSIQ